MTGCARSTCNESLSAYTRSGKEDRETSLQLSGVSIDWDGTLCSGGKNSIRHRLGRVKVLVVVVSNPVGAQVSTASGDLEREESVRSGEGSGRSQRLRVQALREQYCRAITRAVSAKIEMHGLLFELAVARDYSVSVFSQVHNRCSDVPASKWR